MQISNRISKTIALLAVISTSISPAKAVEPILLDGTGQVMAIIDVGFDVTIPALKDRVIAEACFVSYSSCPNGQSSMEGAGAATLPTDLAILKKMTHGTAMASVALQIAPKAKVVLVRDAGFDANGNIQMAIPQLREGLKWIQANASKYGITSVSISQGAALMSCNSANNATEQLVISDLKSKGIPVFLPAGNGSNPNRVDYPACTPDAITVGGLDKRPDSQVAPYIPDMPWTQTNISPVIDFWGLVRWITVNPGGLSSITTGTSNTAAAFNGYWSILKQAKPTATYQEIYDAITKTATIFTTSQVPNGLRADFEAAADYLAGTKTKIGYNIPTGSTSTVSTLIETSIEAAPLPKPDVRGSLGSYTTTLYPEGFVAPSIYVSDTVGVTSIGTYFSIDSGTATLVDQAVIKNPLSINYDPFINIPASVKPGSIINVLIRATNPNGTTEKSIGTFKVIPVPADKTRPTFDFNSTYQNRAQTQLYKPGASVPIYVNARDDVKLISASYYVIDPSGKKSEYPLIWYSGPLITTRGYNASFVIPKDAALGSTYTLSATVSDTVGKSPEQVYAVVKLEAPIPTPKPSQISTPTPSPTPAPSSTTSTPKSQTITFANIPNQEMGGAYRLSATSSSALPITYTVQTPNTCAIKVNGSITNVVAVTPTTILSSISCTIKASQAGDSTWLPATDVTKSFSFLRARMAVTAGGTTSLVGAGPFTFNATLNPVNSSLRAGQIARNQTVSAISLNPTICTVTGVTFDSAPLRMYSLITIQGLKNGICSIKLSAVGNITDQDATQTVQRIFSGIK